MNIDKTNSLLDIALRAVRLDTSEYGDYGLYCGLRDIAIELANDGNFSEALSLCNEIEDQEYMQEALVGISMEMLNQGDRDGALKIVESALEYCRNQANEWNELTNHNEFPEKILLNHLDQLRIAGLHDLVHAIQTIALARVEQMEQRGLQLHCYMVLLESFAIYWREKAEWLIDQLLGLPLCSMSAGIEVGIVRSGESALCEMALIIRKYDLNWSDDRRERFLRHILPVNRTFEGRRYHH